MPDRRKRKVLMQMRDLRVGNGIAACMMNYYEYTVQQGYSIDFLLNRYMDSPHTELIKKYGSKVYVLPHDTGKPDRKNYVYMKKVVTKEYDILHVNISGLNALEALRTAKKAGVGSRIYHAHNPKETSSVKAIIRSALYETLSVRLANGYAACSLHAGDSLFGRKPYTVLKNAVNVSEFQYDEEARRTLRRELQMENKFVTGVVGRFVEQKNPYFIIDIFEEIKKLKPDSILIWAGDGNLRDSIIRYTTGKKLGESVKFLGTRHDVNKLYSAMDIFLLPSRFEGLGLVFVEAQISGLPCFGSDRVPEDVVITENMHRVSLKKDAREWAKEMTDYIDRKRKENRRTVECQEFEIEKLKPDLKNLYDRSLEMEIRI